MSAQSFVGQLVVVERWAQDAVLDAIADRFGEVDEVGAGSGLGYGLGLGDGGLTLEFLFGLHE